MLDVEQGGRDRAGDADPDHAVNAAVHHVKSIAESTRSVIPISETRQSRSTTAKTTRF
jgi:hypothetical protein